MYELKHIDQNNLSSQSSWKNNVSAILDEVCLSRPGSLAFIESLDGKLRTTTFKELKVDVIRKAGYFKSYGIGYNDIILVLEPISRDLYSTLLAIFRVGATAVFIDPSMERKNIEKCLDLVNPKAIVATPKYAMLAMFIKRIRQIPKKIIDKRKTWSSNIDVINLSACPTRPSDNALITFTSGTSGMPKAISRSHQFLKTQLDVLKDELNIQADQIELTALPMFVLANIACGSTTVLSKTRLNSPAKASPKLLYREIEISGADSILASPILIENLVDYLKNNNLKLIQIRKILTGGGVVSQKLVNSALAVFPQAEFTTVYGSSEAEPIAHQSHKETEIQDQVRTNAGCGLLVGRPVDSVDARILTDETMNSSMPARHIMKQQNFYGIEFGEIIVSGAHVVKHYFKNIGDQNTKILLDGKIWHKTGDIGYFDSEGRLWITGSKEKGGIDTRFSFSVEEAANSLLEKKTAFVKTNKSGVLFIEQNPATSETITDSEIPEQLKWAGIDKVRVIKRLPRDRRHNTKILYSELSS